VYSISFASLGYLFPTCVLVGVTYTLLIFGEQKVVQRLQQVIA